jgi:glucose/arabinose dehydrogenase
MSPQGSDFAARRVRLFYPLLVFVLGAANPIRADETPIDWPTLVFTQPVTNKFNRPVCITRAGDNSQRLFVVEQTGRVWIIQSNSVLAQPFLDISSKVLSNGAEQGFLGLAFPPGFSNSHHFYVDYTRQTDGAIVISRFFLSLTNSNVADTQSEQIIKIISKPIPTTTFNNHNAGQLAFGPDGYLYIGIGDGGSEGDPLNNGQKASTLLGKILRIDVESGATPYAVPPDNPFVGNTNYAPEIWALGLRNPWRFSFDDLTGDLYIGDVGQNKYEEIDFQPAGSLGGQNYGWRVMEGTNNYTVPFGFTNFSSLTPPVSVYDHASLPFGPYGSGAVIGGYVYRGPSLPRMNGMYFFGDFSVGWMWGMKQVGTNWQSQPLLKPPYSSTSFQISTFGEDDQGNLYWADYYRGKIYQIADSGLVWTPTFSPAGGTINSNTVIVGCLTTNAEIHYTTNGADPTQLDPMVISGTAIQVATGVTNKLRAFRPDLSPSQVASAVFTDQVGTPVFSPGSSSVTNGTLVSLSTVTPSARIYYTIDSSIPTTNALSYAGSIAITNDVTLKAFGVASGYNDSAVATAAYSLAQAATPVFNPSSGPITNGTSITLSCSTPGSRIYYTLDRSTPTTNSALYSQPIPLNGGTTLNAFATASGYLDSSVISVFYQLVQTATPVFNPSSGPLTNGTQIAITCETPKSVIYYTVDGSSPTTNSFVYSGPVALFDTNGPATLSALASTPGHLDSLTQTASFGLLDYEKTVVTTLAGQSTAGFSNAVGGLAMFSNPQGICIDKSGNLYVADTGNNVIRKISSSGLVTTFAGTGDSGSNVGAATNAQFSGPSGVCVDDVGNVYVADGNNCNRVCRIDTNGIVSVLAEIYGDCLHAPGLWQLVADSSGNVYVGSWASVQEITPNGTVMGLAGPHSCCPGGWGGNVGPGIDIATNIYAATGNLVWKIAPDGTTSLFAGGNGGQVSDGPPLFSVFQNPLDVAVDSNTNVFVADSTSVRKIALNHFMTTLAGTTGAGFQNGSGPIAQFNGAYGLCADSNGNVFAADSANNCIREISPDTAGIGIPDWWQLKYFGHVGIDPNADPDHDGMSNYSEFWSGTDPLDPESVLAINLAALDQNGTIQVRWQTVAGKTYAVEYSDDLISWNNLAGTIQGDGSIATASDPSSMQAEQRRYYRIQVFF